MLLYCIQSIYFILFTSYIFYVIRYIKLLVAQYLNLLCGRLVIVTSLLESALFKTQIKQRPTERGLTKFGLALAGKAQ